MRVISYSGGLGSFMAELYDAIAIPNGAGWMKDKQFYTPTLGSVGKILAALCEGGKAIRVIGAVRG